VVAAKDKAAVDRAWLDSAGLKTLKGAENEPFCVFLFALTPGGTYSRMFAPEYGIPEDPASGSCMGPLAVYMMRHDLIPNAGDTRFVNEQGTKMGRRSLLHVEVRGKSAADGIYVGGYVTPIVEAVMTLGSPLGFEPESQPFIRENIQPPGKRELPGRKLRLLPLDELHRDPEAAAWASRGGEFLCLRSSLRKLSAVRSVLSLKEFQQGIVDVIHRRGRSAHWFNIIHAFGFDHQLGLRPFVILERVNKFFQKFALLVGGPSKFHAHADFGMHHPHHAFDSDSPAFSGA
jgi:hypothetical protein